MAKRTHTIKTEDGDLRVRVTLNVAADFEDDTGISIYDGDSSFLRSPLHLRKFLYLASKAQHADDDGHSIERVGEMIDGMDYTAVIGTLVTAIYGEEAAEAAKEARGKARASAAKAARDAA